MLLALLPVTACSGVATRLDLPDARRGFDSRRLHQPEDHQRYRRPWSLEASGCGVKERSLTPRIRRSIAAAPVMLQRRDPYRPLFTNRGCRKALRSPQLPGTGRCGEPHLERPAFPAGFDRQESGGTRPLAIDGAAEPSGGRARSEPPAAPSIFRSGSALLLGGLDPDDSLVIPLFGVLAGEDDHVTGLHLL